MSKNLGITKLYLSIGEFNKILKLKDYQDMEVIDIKKDDADKTIEFRIVAPMNSVTEEDTIVPYNSHYEVKRKAINLESPKDSWYIGLDRNDLARTDEELGKLIKDECNRTVKEIEGIETVNFKVFINKDYE